MSQVLRRHRAALSVSTGVAALGVALISFSAAGPAFATDYPPVATTSAAPTVLATSVSRASTAAKPPKVTPVIKVLPVTGTLAYTGSDDIVGGLILGASLVALGGGALVAGRRRSSRG